MSNQKQLSVNVVNAIAAKITLPAVVEVRHPTTNKTLGHVLIGKNRTCTNIEKLDSDTSVTEQYSSLSGAREAIWEPNQPTYRHMFYNGQSLEELGCNPGK